MDKNKIIIIINEIINLLKNEKINYAYEPLTYVAKYINQLHNLMIKELITDFFNGRWKKITNGKLNIHISESENLKKLFVILAKQLNLFNPLVVIYPGLAGTIDTYDNHFEKLKYFDFIITEKGDFFIHLKDFFTQIWTQISQGEKTGLKYINRNLEIALLTTSEQNAIINRFHEAKTIFDFVVSDKEFNEKSRTHNVLEKLQALRLGLLLGDVNHQGSEFTAGKSANIAIAEFNEYYLTLSYVTKNILRNLKSKTYVEDFGMILDLLFDNKFANRGSANYCVENLGRIVEAIINDNYIKLREMFVDEEYQKLINNYKTIIYQLENEAIFAIIKDDLLSFEMAFTSNDRNCFNVPPNAKDLDTYLHLCSVYNANKIAEYLLNQTYINIEALNINFETPLFYAVKYKRENIVKMLIEKGAFVFHVNINFIPLISIAAEAGNLSIFEMLYNKGLDISIKTRFGSPLFKAAEMGHVEIVKYLINKKVDINVKSSFHFNATPLHIASQNGHYSTVKALIENGADVNAFCLKINLESRPLFLAITNGHIRVASLLIDAGATLDFKIGEYQVSLLTFTMNMLEVEMGLMLIKKFLEKTPMDQFNKNILFFKTPPIFSGMNIMIGKTYASESISHFIKYFSNANDNILKQNIICYEALKNNFSVKNIQRDFPIIHHILKIIKKNIINVLDNNFENISTDDHARIRKILYHKNKGFLTFESSLIRKYNYILDSHFENTKQYLHAADISQLNGM